MEAWTSIKTGLSKSFVVKGRAPRPEFWWLWAFHFFVPVALTSLISPLIVDVRPNLAEVLVLLGMCVYLLSTPATFCAIVRRQHDVGKSGKLAGMIYVGVLVVASALALFLVYKMSKIDLTEYAKDVELDHNPIALIVMLPMVIAMGFIQIFTFAIFAMMVLFLVGPPVLLVLMIFGIALAKASQPGPNPYGPNPYEVTT